MLHYVRQASMARSVLTELCFLERAEEHHSEHHLVFLWRWFQEFWIALHFEIEFSELWFLWGNMKKILSTFYQSKYNPNSNPRFCLNVSTENMYFEDIFYPEIILYYLLNWGWTKLWETYQGNAYTTKTIMLIIS